MNLPDTVTALEQRVRAKTDFPHTVCFDFGEDGALVVDGGTAPPRVSVGHGAADLVVQIAKADFDHILSGALNPQAAAQAGRIKLAGNAGLAMKLDALLKP